MKTKGKYKPFPVISKEEALEQIRKELKSESDARRLNNVIIKHKEDNKNGNTKKLA